MKIYLELQNLAGYLACTDDFDNENFEEYMRLMKEFWPISPGDKIIVHTAEG